MQLLLLTTHNYQEATTTFTPFFSSCLINEAGAPSSVITYCTSLISQIFPIPLFPNFVLSARMTTLCADLIILWFKPASAKLLIEKPKSTSIPSTPKNSIPQDMLSKICSACTPATDVEFGLTSPPSC